MWEWIVNLFYTYWPVLFILLGIALLIVSLVVDEIFAGISYFILLAGIGIFLLFGHQYKFGNG